MREPAFLSAQLFVLGEDGFRLPVEGAPMQEIAKVLAGCGELGPGAVFRAVRETQRRLVR